MTARSGRSEFWPSALRLVGSLLALALLAYLLAEQGWGEFLNALAQIPWTAFTLAFLLVIISRLSTVSRWYFLLRTAQVEVPWRLAFTLTFAGLFASNFLPTTVGGDVIRIAGVGQVEARRTAYVTSVFADRIVGMLGMAMALPFGIGPLWAYFQARGGEVLAMGLATAVSGGLVGRLRARAAQVVHAVIESLRLWRASPLTLLAAFGSTWVIMLCRFGSIWILLHALGESIGLGTIGGLWAFTYFVTLVPVSINGLGLQEVSMTFIYQALGHVTATSILPTAILVRAMDTLVSLPGALLLPQTLRWTRRPSPEGEAEL